MVHEPSGKTPPEAATVAVLLAESEPPTTKTPDTHLMSCYHILFYALKYAALLLNTSYTAQHSLAELLTANNGLVAAASQ